MRNARSLLLVAAAAWIGVLIVGRGMGSMPGTMGFGIATFAAVWALMMAAMMLPAVAPFAAVYARTFGDRRALRLGTFVAGYLAIWAVTALPVYALARVADRLVSDHPGGATVLAFTAFACCGVYQLTPLKDTCLTWCRSPLAFAVQYSGYRGRTRDLRVGMHHGAYCLGCCWALMVLLIAFGLMNVAAIAVLTLVVLAERTKPWGPRLGRAVGVSALALAIGVIFLPNLAPALHPDTRSTMTMHKEM
jgi:predicted metal-binding membrane protein